MAPDVGEVQRKINQIENEMKRIGFWRQQPLAPEKYAFTRAFAADTMTFGQWLQFVFIPQVRSIIASKGTFPSRSSVGAKAIREFDTVPDADRLVALLCEFDELFQ